MAMRRGVRYTFIAMAALAVIAVSLVWVLTRTQFGVERAGHFALERIRASVNGQLDVDRVTSGGLLSGVTLHDIALTGPDGRAFLEADSARLAYRFRTLARGSMVFDRVILHSPTVTVEQLPGQEEWNFERIFPPDSAAPLSVARNTLVLIRDATVHDGRVVLRSPWEPDGPVEPDDTARMILESVPGGLVRTMRFEALNGRIPRIVWEAPGEDARLIEIETLATRAYLWDTPVDIEGLEGAITLRDSLVSFDIPRVRLPDSELAVIGRIILDDDGSRFDIELDGRDVAFSDFQWLYPQLPVEGGGTLQLRIQTRDPGSILWLAQEARLRTAGTEVAGSFGVVTGDTLFFTNVDLDASPLDLELIQRLVPGDLPLEGLLIGTVEVEGPISALRTRGDVRLRTFREGQGAESTVRWSGTVGGRPPYDVRGLTADIRSLDLEQVAQFAPELRVRGLATGRVRIGGSLESGLQVDGDLALDREEGRSAVRGSGVFAVAGDRSAFDLRFDAETVALQLLAEQFPGLHRLAGEATGPVIVTGSLEDLRVDADLMTPAGAVIMEGSFALAGPVPGYRVEGMVTGFQLHRVVEDLPETVVTGRFDIDGEGDRLETIDARGRLEVLSATIAGIAVRRSFARGSVAGGLLYLDSLSLATDVGTAHAAGSFGLLAGSGGDLTFSAEAGALSFLEPVVFPEPRVARTTNGAAMEPTARLDGEVTAGGVLTGSLEDWSVRGNASVRELVFDEIAVAAGEADFEWAPDTVAIEAWVDSLRHRGRQLPHALGTVHWSPRGGRLVARARGPGAHQLDVEGGFTRLGDNLELRLRELTLTTREGRWAIADTVRARVGRNGFQVDSLTLRRLPEHARIRVAGALPWRRAGQSKSLMAALAIDFEDVRIGELLRVAQSDTTIDGSVTAQFRVSGTATAPRLDGRFSAQPLRYGGAVLDSAGGEVTYSDRVVRTRFAGWRGGDPILSGTGTIPLELALADRAERLLDRPMTVRLTADRVPAGLVSFLAPGFRELDGIVDGELALVGTPLAPTLEGELRLTDGSGTFTPLDVQYQDINGTASIGSTNVVDIDVRLRTERGEGHLRGTMDVTQTSDPRLNLALSARNFDAARRSDVTAVASGNVRVTGHYTRPVVSGDVHILRGEMNLDELWRQYQIVQLDPSLFQMFDSTAVDFRPPPQLPFLENLVITGATVTADRSFWLRSRELNVEVSGSIDIEVDRQVGDLRLSGSLEALNGNYALQLVQGVPARTFAIRGGTIEFLGTPGIDPGLEIEAGYHVRRAQGEPIDVVARVTGTLKDPRVELSSDSDLPLSESDLASYILFGRTGAELTQAQTDVVSSGIGLVRPMATAILSTGLRQALAGTPIDHVAFTTPEYGLGRWQEQGIMGVFYDTQVELGFDATRDLSFVVSSPIPTGTSPESDSAPIWRQIGARVEWRFRPTWTSELYIEDRFARTPSFNLTEIDGRKVMGVSVFREWGY